MYEVRGNQEGHLKVFIDTPFAEYYEQSGGCDFTFEFIPGMFNFPYLRFLTGGSIGTVSWWCYAGFFFDSENSDNGSQAPPSYDESYEIRVANEFYGKVTIPDVIEVFEVVDLAVGDYDTIDGSKFPSFGGTAQADGVAARKCTFYEIIPEGTEILLEATVGDASTTNSFVTPSDIVLTYPVRVLPTIEASVDLGTVGDTNQIVGDWEVLFEGEALTANWGTITPDAQGSFIDWDNGKARAIFSMSGSGYGLADADMYLAPAIVYDCHFKAFSFASNYPGSIGLWLWDRATWIGSAWVPAYKTVTASPTHFEQVVQQYYILTGGTNLSTNTSVDLQEWQGIRWNLDPANLNGEDADDWRVQIRGTQWKCYDVLQNSTFTLDNGNSATGWSGGANTTYSNTGSAHRAVISGGAGSVVWSPGVDKNLEGFRYLGIRIKSTDANKPFTVRLSHTDGEDKEYSGETGAADTLSAVVFDLCKPDTVDDNDDSADDDVFTQDSRYPLEGGASTVPTLSDDIWGFNVFDTLTIEGLEDGQTYEVDFIQLERDTFAKIGFLPAFEPWKDGYTSNQVKSQFWTNADGRFCDDHFATKTTSPSYTWLAITAFESALERRLGWDATPGGTLPADTYHTNSLEALLIEGGGVRWAGGSTFVPAWNLDVTTLKEIKAQALWDEIQAYPGAGDVWGPGAYAESTEVGATKQLRGGLWGLVFKKGNGPKSGQVVELKTEPGGAGAGQGTSDTLGFYATGSVWGVNGDYKGYCKDLVSPEFEVYNRFPHRLSWLPIYPPSSGPWNLHTPWGHYHRLDISDSDVNHRRAEQPIPFGGFESEVAVLTGYEWARATYDPSTAGIIGVVSDGTDAYLSQTNDDGTSYNTVAAILTTVSYPTINHTPNGGVLVAGFRLDTGTAGTIVGKYKGPGDTAWSSEFDFEDASAAIDFEEGSFHFSPAPDGSDVFILVAKKAGETGVTEFYSADNGATWTEV